MQEMNLELPKQLKEYENTIKKSIKPFIRVTSKKTKTTLWESKIGGYPYFPRSNENYPKDKNGKPMRILAQINFSELPHIGLFPSEGILQFYISAEDDVYGMNFDDGRCQDNFRVIYHKEIIQNKDELVEDFSFLDNLDDKYFPVSEEGRMIFSKDSEPVSIEDYQFENYIGTSAYSFFDEFDQEAEDFYYENFLGDGHKIGGYAYFTQCDPRESELSDYEILLLQLDSDDNLNMMWGDCGVANFFIKREDLLNLNFNNVLYNWDCS
ncbi:YwqG family protein [Clostridium sediminicola]|uniref:YwqG family protein n=1 Tax=Clostridium sediminicola TaxID=3114879 RepID=UPI0031F1C5D1